MTLIANGKRANEGRNSAPKRTRETKQEISNVVVRVKSEDFSLQLLFLIRESEYFRRRVDRMFSSPAKEKPSPTFIGIPVHSPLTPDIFRIIVNFFSGKMKESDMSLENIVKLILSSEFLQMANLKRRAWKFLNDRALTTWESCLSVLSTFDPSHLPEDKDNAAEAHDVAEEQESNADSEENGEEKQDGGSEENDEEQEDGDSEETMRNRKRRKITRPIRSRKTEVPNKVTKDPHEEEHHWSTSVFEKLFGTIKRAFLDKVERLNTWQSPQSYNLIYFFRVGKLLPPQTAEIIYRSMVTEKYAWCYEFGFTGYNVCCRSSRPSAQAFEVRSYPHRGGLIAVLNEQVRTTPNNSTLISYLIKLIRRQDSSATIIICFHFLCFLLFQAQALTPRSGVEDEIVYLEKLVVDFFRVGLSEDAPARFTGQPNIQFVINFDHKIHSALAMFDFSSLHSIVSKLPNLPDEERRIGVAKIFDTCLALHLENATLSVSQVLLIYEVYPNEGRKSHVEIYRVFEDRHKLDSLSLNERTLLLKILDFNKLPDEIVESLLREHHGLAEIVLKILGAKRLQEGLTRLELFRLRSELNEKTLELKAVDAVKKQMDDELVGLRNQVNKKTSELTNKTLEFDTILACKIRVESELKVAIDKVEKEKDKLLCQICLAKPRDSLSLPCLHFQYCSQCLDLHHRRVKECPTCRGSTEKTLKCIM